MSFLPFLIHTCACACAGAIAIVAIANAIPFPINPHNKLLNNNNQWHINKF
jgi:hypothetical protein